MKDYKFEVRVSVRPVTGGLYAAYRLLMAKLAGRFDGFQVRKFVEENGVRLPESELAAVMYRASLPAPLNSLTDDDWRLLRAAINDERSEPVPGEFGVQTSVGWVECSHNGVAYGVSIPRREFFIAQADFPIRPNRSDNDDDDPHTCDDGCRSNGCRHRNQQY